MCHDRAQKRDEQVFVCDVTNIHATRKLLRDPHTQSCGQNLAISLESGETTDNTGRNHEDRVVVVFEKQNICPNHKISSD